MKLSISKYSSSKHSDHCRLSHIYKYSVLLCLLAILLTSCRNPKDISKETGASKVETESIGEPETSSWDDITDIEESIESDSSEESSISEETSLPESGETESGMAQTESVSSDTGTHTETTGGSKTESSSESASTNIPEETPAPNVQVPFSSLEGLPAGTILNEENIDPENLDLYFTASDITESSDIFQRINGKSYRKETSIALSNLCYVKLIHRNYEGRIQVGEIIINKSIASDFIAIFKELYRQNYEIYSMYLVDDFWTGNPNDSDAASMNANNTSSFNDRTVDYSGNTSRHSYGTAIDINPRENPYVLYDKNGNPYTTQDEKGAGYIDRSERRPHMMYSDDLCVKLFKERGFRWGGDWSSLKDYQHFDKK